MRKRAVALVVAVLAGAVPAAALIPWFGTDPGPYRLHYAETWQLPALLNTLEQRCDAVVVILPLDTIGEVKCVPPALPPPPPGGWGCHPVNPHDPNSPVVCVDPPVYAPGYCETVTTSTTRSVLVASRKGECQAD